MANAGQSLQGTVSGLRVVNISGQPGKDPNIVLRGGATMTGKDNGALVVVDVSFVTLWQISTLQISSPSKY